MKQFGIACVLLVSMGVAAAGQSPLLKITPIPMPGGVGINISATNIYTAPASEYIVDFRYHLPPGVQCQPTNVDATGQCTSGVGRHWAPTFVPGTGTMLPPGKSASIGSNRATEVVSATNIAVIYTDGTSAGDPFVIRQMMAERAEYVADLQAEIPVLAAAAADGRTDPTALRQRFIASESAHEGQYSAARLPELPAVYGPSEDRVCRDIASELAHVKSGLSADQISAELLRIVDHMKITLAAALASKPVTLPQGAPPSQ